jgi:hypothetical protein
MAPDVNTPKLGTAEQTRGDPLSHSDAIADASGKPNRPEMDVPELIRRSARLSGVAAADAAMDCGSRADHGLRHQPFKPPLVG